MRLAKLGAQLLSIVLVASLLGLLIWKVTNAGDGGAAAALRRGDRPPAPDFELQRLDAPGVLRLSSLRGKPVVLNFWASWCGPCKREAPVLERTWQQHRDEGLVVVGVAIRDFDSDSRRFAERYGMTFPLVDDGRGSLWGRYGLKGVPETFFIDRRGRLVGEPLLGPVSDGEFAEKFEEYVSVLVGA